MLEKLNSLILRTRPNLFPILRVLVDDSVKKYRFLILDSAPRDLIRQSSETLAGKATKSMHIALTDLKLDHLYIIFPGQICFPVSDQITVCGLDKLSEIIIITT